MVCPIENLWLFPIPIEDLTIRLDHLVRGDEQAQENRQYIDRYEDKELLVAIHAPLLQERGDEDVDEGDEADDLCYEVH